MENGTEIKGLTFDDFKTITMERVRDDNNKTLVKSWEDNVLHSEFSESIEKDFYSARIYFIDEFSIYNYYIKMYRFSYCTQILYEEGYEIIDMIALKKIALLENLISKNNKTYSLYDILKEFQECADKIEIDR